MGTICLIMLIKISLSVCLIIIDVISKSLNYKIEWRYKEISHHYTDNGIEVEIFYKRKWLEILECGLAGKIKKLIKLL
jgi:phenylalanyl-tRNA synthetase alpha subunit